MLLAGGARGGLSFLTGLRVRWLCISLFLSRRVWQVLFPLKTFRKARRLAIVLGGPEAAAEAREMATLGAEELTKVGAIVIPCEVSPPHPHPHTTPLPPGARAFASVHTLEGGV